MYPILYRIGPFLIYGYSVALWLGLAVGIGLTAVQVKYSRAYQGITDWFEAVLVCLIAGMVGGRLGYVLGEWSYFQERLPLIWRFGQGGYNYHGALLAALIGLGLWRWWRRRPYGTILALFTPAFALGCAFGWLACWLEGCAYGKETFIGPLAADMPDTFGIFTVRYQTQMMGILLSLLIFLLVLWLRRWWRTAVLFWFTLFLISLSRIPISLLRGDPAAMWAGFRIDTLLDVTLALISLILLQYTWIKQRHSLSSNAHRGKII